MVVRAPENLEEIGVARKPELRNVSPAKLQDGDVRPA